jgi:hypothetical protein
MKVTQMFLVHASFVSEVVSELYTIVYTNKCDAGSSLTVDTTYSAGQEVPCC